MANQILSNAPQALSTVAVLYVAPGAVSPIYPSIVDCGIDPGQGNLLTPSGGFSFRSNNSYVASVDSSGLVTGVNVGETSIEITYANSGLTGSVVVIVTTAPLKVGPLSRSNFTNLPSYAAIGPA